MCRERDRAKQHYIKYNKKKFCFLKKNQKFEKKIEKNYSNDDTLLSTGWCIDGIHIVVQYYINMYNYYIEHKEYEVWYKMVWLHPPKTILGRMLLFFEVERVTSRVHD